MCYSSVDSHIYIYKHNKKLHYFSHGWIFTTLLIWILFLERFLYFYFPQIHPKTAITFSPKEFVIHNIKCRNVLFFCWLSYWGNEKTKNVIYNTNLIFLFFTFRLFLSNFFPKTSEEKEGNFFKKDWTEKSQKFIFFSFLRILFSDSRRDGKTLSSLHCNKKVKRDERINSRMWIMIC